MPLHNRVCGRETSYSGESTMKTVRIEEEDHTQLVAYAAYKALELKRQVNLAQAIHFLLETATSDKYRKEVLKK